MAMAWCGYSRKGRQYRASSGGGAAGWSVSTSIPYILWLRCSNKALRPFSRGVYGWVFCAKNWLLHRLKGELLLQQDAGSGDEAETCFCQALDVARCQQAKSLELRAAMSLARLWQRQGKRDEARQLLADVYGWFTEGFDTADLREAKTLLEELA